MSVASAASAGSYYRPGMPLRSQSTTRHPSVVLGVERVDRDRFEGEHKFSEDEIDREIEALKRTHGTLAGGAGADATPSEASTVAARRKYHKMTTKHIEHGTLRDRKSLVDSVTQAALMHEAMELEAGLPTPLTTGDGSGGDSPVTAYDFVHSSSSKRESTGSLHGRGGAIGGPLGATESELSVMSANFHPLRFADGMFGPTSIDSDAAATVGEMDSLPPMDELVHFDKHKELGTGTDAYVYEVVDRRDASHVAMKLTKRKSGRYRTEINLLNALRSCPFVVRLIKVLENESVYVLILEQAPMTLEMLLHERCTEEPMRESLAKPLVRHVLLGIKAVNGLGFVHKDIKPENVLIFVDSLHRSLRAKIADFGFATRVEPEHSTSELGTGVSRLPESIYSEFLDRVGDKCGTPGFWAPELVAGVTELSEAYKLDVFGAGVCLYRMLCNEMPFGLFETWELKEGRKLAKMKPNFQCISWLRVIQTDPATSEQRVDYVRKMAAVTLSEPCTDLIRGMLRIRPHRRLSVHECLRHRWLLKARDPGTSATTSSTVGSSLSGSGSVSSAKSPAVDTV